MKKKVAVVGGGPAGCTCAYFLNHDFEITVFDENPMKTILPTGGGRCNLAYAEYDFKDLAKNYPRGEKFLYSVFSEFSTSNTLNFFEEIGIKTYTQEDNRIFPVSDSAKEVRTKLLAQLNHCRFIKEKVSAIKPFEYSIEIKTANITRNFDYVIIAIGGHGNYDLIKNLKHKIIPPQKALIGLKTKENFNPLQGVSLSDISIKFDKKEICGDIIFTQNGLSGPLILKLSSINAYKTFPYSVTLNFLNTNTDFQELFDKNPHKELHNLLSEFLPKSFVDFQLKNSNINPKEKCHQINSQTKKELIKIFKNFDIEFISTENTGELVMAGGIDLKEINPKTLESKIIKNIYFCGEILDIDGFCGGFNLQNCWSTGYKVANSINTLFKS